MTTARAPERRSTGAHTSPVDGRSILTDLLQALPVRLSGIGVDVVEIERFRAVLASAGGLLHRSTFTPGELRYASGKRDPQRHLAGIFAAKEASWKALRIDWREAALSWNLIEIVHDDSRAPAVRLHGAARGALERSGANAIFVTISYGRTQAFAAAAVAHDRV